MFTKKSTNSEADRIYETCRAFVVKTQRRRSYKREGEFWGITSKSLFLRKTTPQSSADTVLPWSQIVKLSIHKAGFLDTSRMIVQSPERKVKLILPDSPDVEIVPFLNSLCDHAKLAGVDTGELDAFLAEGVYPDRGRILEKLDFPLLFIGICVLLPLCVALPAFAAIYGFINWTSLQIDSDPFRFTSIVVGSILACTAVLCTVFYLAFRWGGKRAKNRIREKTRKTYEHRFSQLDEKSWEIYRRKREQIREEKQREREKRWDRIVQAREFFGDAPRKIGTSYKKAFLADYDMLFIIYFGCCLFFLTMIVLILIGTGADGEKRAAYDLLWFKWKPAGTAVVSRIESTQCASPSHVEITLTRTLPDGNERVRKDPRHLNREDWKTGSTIAIEEFDRRTEVFRIAASEIPGDSEVVPDKFIPFLVLLATIFMCLIFLYRWKFGIRTLKSLLERGELRIGRLVPCGDYPLAKIRNSGNSKKIQCSFEMGGENKTEGLELFFHQPGGNKAVRATPLLETTSKDSEHGEIRFSRRKRTLILPAIFTFASLEFLIILVLLFTA